MKLVVLACLKGSGPLDMEPDLHPGDVGRFSVLFTGVCVGFVATRS